MVSPEEIPIQSVLCKKNVFFMKSEIAHLERISEIDKGKKIKKEWLL